MCNPDIEILLGPSLGKPQPYLDLLGERHLPTLGECGLGKGWPSGARSRADGHPDPLLSVHNTTITMSLGGSYAQVKIGQPDQERTRSPHKRGKISGFTRHSRRRFMDEVNSLDDSKLADVRAVFLTLTYHSFYPKAADSKADLERLLRRIRQEFDGYGWWKLEPQQRGAPHFHLVIFLQPSQATAFKEWAPGAWHKIAGHGSADHLAWHQGLLGNGNKHCCKIIPWADRKTILCYLTKYIAKQCGEVEGWEWPGRFWGRVQPERVDALKTMVSKGISRETAFKLRRLMWRWIGSQPSGRCRIQLDNKWQQVQVGSPAWKFAKKNGYEIQPIMRKPHKGYGGCKCYLPASEFTRLLYFLGIEVDHGSQDIHRDKLAG